MPFALLRDAIMLAHRKQRSWIARSALVLVTALSVSGASAIWVLRQDAAATAEEDLRLLGSVIAEHTARTFHQADLVLQGALAEVARQVPDGRTGLRPAFSSEAAHAAMARRFADISQIESMSLIDPAGALVLSTRLWPAPPLDLSDRDFFEHIRANPEQALFISRASVSRVDGGITVYLVRPLHAADGSAIGIITAGLNLSHFDSIFASAGVRPGMAITLTNAQGDILNRHPQILELNQTIASTEWYARAAAGGGVYHSPGRLDQGGGRYVRVQPVPSYPLVIGVSRLDSAVFLSWERQAIGIGSGILLATLLIAFITRLLLRQLHAIEHSTRRLNDDAQALRKSQSLLAETGRLAGIGGWEVDIASGEVSWTEETRRIHAVDDAFRPDLDNAIEFYAPQARPVIRAAVEICLADGTPWDLELPFIRADGQARWVRAVGSSVTENGRAVRLVGAIKDVTAQVEARQTLDLANERVAIAVEDAGIGIWEWTIGTDDVDWDPSMYRLYGRQPDDCEVSYAIWQHHLHPEDRAATEALLAAAAEDRAHFDTEFRIIWHDGSQRHLRASARLVRDPTGRPTRMVGLNWDVTEPRRLAAERDAQAERLAESDAMLRLVAENATDVITWVGPAGDRRYVSHAAGQLFGMPAASLIGHAPLPFDDDAERDKLNAINESLLDGTRRSVRVTFRIRHPERGSVWIESNAVAMPPREDGGCAGFVAVMRDHTEQMQLEAEREARAVESTLVNAELERLARHLSAARDNAERASRTKTRFLANTSHELRTPLNGILGYTQLLALHGGLDAEQKRWVEAMMGAGTHLLQMITRVLDITAAGEEHGQIEPVELDMSLVIAACIEVVRPAAALKGLRLGVGEGADQPCRVVTDAARLRQIMINLLGNAVKFTASGSVTVRLRHADSAGALRIEVVDTGPGIPLEHCERLFHEFERLDNPAVEGAGLGLALSANLASLLGGRLGHEPNPDGGSIFWLELPRDSAGVLPSPPRAAETATPPLAAPAAQNPPLRVLVVDDVAMNRDIACSLLRMAGHRAEEAGGGEEAIAAVTAGDFDVVLMDVLMPGIDGHEATRRIRALGGARGEIPIVGVTALSFGEQISECLDAGMDSHLAKPYSADALLGATLDAVANAGVRRGARPDPEPPGASDSVKREPPLREAGAVAGLLAHLPAERIAAYDREVLARGVEVLGLLRRPPGDAGDRAALADKLHRLAGSGGLLGFSRMTAMLREWEMRTGGPGTDAAMLNRVTGTIEATIAMIEDGLDSRPERADA